MHGNGSNLRDPRFKSKFNITSPTNLALAMKATEFKELQRALTNAGPQEVARAHSKVDYNTILSIWSQCYTHAIRRTHHQFKSDAAVAQFVGRYRKGETLVSIAESLKIQGRMTFAPCLLARFVLGHFYPKSKQDVSKLMRQPSDIDDERLRREVEDCIAVDMHYSPWATKTRQVVGLKYEFVLEEKLRNCGIPFESETALRAKGHFKTPDIQLLAPISVHGRIVHWIDSKAMFGDEHTHEKNREQFLGYVNRFGSGLVIYWFDFVEGIGADDSDVLVMNHFPQKIQTLSTLSSSLAIT